MRHALFFGLLGSGILTASASRAEIDVAPAPREIRLDGTRDPVPAPVAAKKENPIEVVERIIKNSKAVGDKLAKTDIGAETRGTQTRILKDIESLIDQQENPPSPKPDQSKDKNKDDQNKDKNKDDMQKKDDMMPMDGKNDMQPKKMDMGMDGMGNNHPKDDGEDQPKGRRPRQQAGKDPKEKEGQPKDPMANKQQTQPMGGMQPKDPKNTASAKPDPMGDPKNASRATLPFEEEIVKDVWGHLPDKLRQQATQYYQQDFMPRYTELLKLYYSSLAEKGGKK